MSNESRKARAQRQQSPGMASTGRVDPATGARARRAAAGEQAAGVRYKQGLRVQNDGSLEVHTDATLRVDQRQQLGVRNKFPTPTDGTQAANKDYVDTALGGIVIIGDSEYVVEYNRPPTGPSISTTTSWKVAPPDELYAHNNIVSPSNPAAVYATTTHTGTGDDCVYLYPGYVYGIALSLRCYQSAFELGLLFSPTISATAWNVASRSIRFTEVGDTTTVYLLLDNTDGTYTYVTPAFRRYGTGTAIVSTVRMHARRLHPHYEGGYPALSLPGPPAAPAAGFEAESATLLAFRDELFSNLSTGIVNSVLWDFGDQYTPGVALHGSAERNPVYRYEAGGTFPVAITATGDGGSDTYTANVTVQDVVCTENLLASVGVYDLSDFPTTSRMASVGASPIAAPDGTMTAIRCIGDLTGEATTLAVLNNSAYPIDFTGQWADGLAWTYSFFVYRPSIESGGTNYGKFQFSLVGASGYNNLIQWRCTATNPLYNFVAVTPSTSSFTYSAERNIAVEEVGNSGWTKYTVTLVDTEQNNSNIQLQMQHRGGDHYLDTWAPELRYGDWVARGKNRVTSGDDLLQADWNHTNATVTRSDEVTPAGTSSAVLVVPDLGIRTLNQDGVRQPWETLGSVVGRVTVSAYFKDAGAGYAALGLSNTFGYTATATINLSTGATTTGSHPSAGSDLVASFADIGDGWKLCSFTITMIGNTNSMPQAHFNGSTVAGAGVYNRHITGDGINGVHIWGARVHIGNPADWETVLPFVSGPQNLLGDGSDFGSWTTSGGSSVTTNTAVAPNGRLEADTIQNTQGVFGAKLKAHNVTPTANATYDYIIYFKRDASALAGASELTFAPTLYTSGYARITERVTFRVSKEDPSTSTLTSSTSGGPGYTLDDLEITALSNDWYRWRIRLQDYNGTAAHITYRLESAGAGYSSGAAYDITVAAAEVTTIDPLDPV